MEPETTNANGNIPPYDIFDDQKWLILLIGFAELRDALYIIYILLLYMLNIYVQSMALYGSYMLSPNKSLMMDAFYVFSSSMFAAWGLSCRMFGDRSVRSMRELIKSGIYNYEDEVLEVEQLKMKESIEFETKKKSNAIKLMYFLGFLSNMIFFPLSQLLFLSENDPIHKIEFVNPYLPHNIYIPFNTKNFLGYLSAYMIDFFFLVVLYSTAVSINGIYISCTVQLKAHLRVLNYSLRNIQKRAVQMYCRKNSLSPESSQQDLLQSKEFQNCLYSCFKANVRHHQALLRYKNACQPFNGACLLDVFTLASVIYACMLYLIYQKPPLNIMTTYIFTSLGEQTYCFLMCISGEAVIGESNSLYETLYSIPWFNYDKRFNKALDIMMCNIRKPLTINTLLLDVAPCLETYSGILSAMYKIMSLARQSDVLK